MDFTKPISAEIDIVNRAGAQRFGEHLEAHGIEYAKAESISMVFIFRCKLTKEQYGELTERFPYVLFYQGPEEG